MNDPQDLIYQQREVLWAKIRGYPWWPAYVSTVHTAQNPNDYEYTVIFFGDNTNSRLGPSKLRRFPDNYAQFFVKAKTNKKLKQSIQKAEQRLSQNHQNIKMYENIRNQILSKKKKGTVSQSRLSSSQKMDMEAPDLIKYKTEDISKNRKIKDKKKQTEIFQEQQSQGRQYSDHEGHQKQKINSKQPTIQNRRRRSQNILVQRQSPSKLEKLNIQKQQTPQSRVKRITRKAKQFQISPVISKQPQSRVRNKLNSKQKIQSCSSEKNEKQKKQQEESSQQLQKIRGVPQITGKRRGRKGRPPKALQLERKIQQQQNQNESSSQSEQLQEISIPKRGRKRKIKTFVNIQTLQGQGKVNNQIGSLTQQEAEIIKQNLNNRQILSKILLSMPINTSNVKQILDLGVSLALQQGNVTKTINFILCILKATLLHKYFPDNNKHRRKYQKITKQKKKAARQHQEQQLNENNQPNMNGENNNKQYDQLNGYKIEQQQSIRQKLVRGRRQKQNKQNSLEGINNNKVINNQSGQEKKQKMKQIRQKVVQKLQKMIKKAGFRQSTINYAHIIENTFQQAADLKIDSYKSIAYRRMRNFKTKLSDLSDNMASSAQVKEFIESAIQNYELQNKMPINQDKSNIKV